MLLKVIWSEFAEYQLDEIFDFYCLSAGESVARKLLVELIKEPNKLLKTPFIGQKEPLLIDRKIEYRYIVFYSV